VAVSITRTANPAGVNSASNVATYSGVSIGTADSSRIIVVCVGTELASSTPSGCTIDYGSGDTTMTAGSGGNFGAVYAQTYRLAVPTGTTATIKVTYSSTNPTDTQNHIAVYSVIGATYSSAGNDGSTDMDSSDPLTTGSITIPTAGGFIAVAAGANDTNAKTWANATEDIDADVGAFRFTTATRTTALTTTAVTCKGTSNGEDGALSYIIFSNTPPTVALSSPADGGSTSDTTPDLVFTGTDTSGDDIRYNVQVSDTNYTNPAIRASSKGENTTGTAMSVSAPSGTTAGDFVVIVAHGNGQTTITDNNGSTPFTATAISDWKPNTGNGHTMSVYYRQIQAGDPSTYNFTLGASGRWSLVAVTFTGGHTFDVAPNTTDRINDDSALTGTITVPSLTTTFDKVMHITLCGWDTASVGTISVPSGYTELQTANGGSELLSVAYKLLTTEGATGGTQFINTEFGAMLALSFSVRRALNVNAVSGTDAGFSGSPDNTDPFTSGQAVTYTVQSALDDDTYYWRVRGIDPSGSNAYGAWSGVRSFTVDTSGGGGAVVKDIIGGFIPFAR